MYEYGLDPSCQWSLKAFAPACSYDLTGFRMSTPGFPKSDWARLADFAWAHFEIGFANKLRGLYGARVHEFDLETVHGPRVLRELEPMYQPLQYLNTNQTTTYESMPDARENGVSLCGANLRVTLPDTFLDAVKYNRDSLDEERNQYMRIGYEWTDGRSGTCAELAFIQNRDEGGRFYGSLCAQNVLEGGIGDETCKLPLMFTYELHRHGVVLYQPLDFGKSVAYTPLGASQAQSKPATSGRNAYQSHTAALLSSESTSDDS